VTRAERQQRVLQSLSGKLASPGTLIKLPSVGGDLLKPLATDLSAAQFAQLAWVKLRSPAGRALHCRLGGSASTIGGESVIVSTQENFAVIHMFTGDSAPQPPPPGSGPYGPGCAVGSKSLSH
jgi:anionic cell wall polymer biosynthesis LytR-Cps2A-Psr (LCP) family protein